jgi:tryptophan 2,3-dioxygenase
MCAKPIKFDPAVVLSILNRMSEGLLCDENSTPQALVGHVAVPQTATAADPVLLSMVSLCLLCLVINLLQQRSISLRLAKETLPGKKGDEPPPAGPPAAVTSTHVSDGAGGCPFGYSASSGAAAAGPSATVASGATKGASSRTGHKKVGARELAARRVITLYEDYIHLHDLQCVWDNPVTDTPRLEPSFAAGMHGIELAFMLMAEFLKDSRAYVVKRPRIEMVAEDIVAQCKLLQEIVDGELEDEACSGREHAAATLTQDFPFEAAPPTCGAPEGADGGGNCTEDMGYGRQSPGLDMLVDAVSRAFQMMSGPERQSVIRIIHNITGQFDVSFRRWTVGLGCEEQLATLRECVGLPAVSAASPRTAYLDYAVLVRPQACANTLLREHYTHNEDFFFRTVHLGTECWGYVALGRLRSAKEQVELHRHWQNAAAHVHSAAHILEYLGSHISMLTSMILRDYLQLKVEIEGTSGEGSTCVRCFRPLVESLFVPLAAELLGPEVAAAWDPAQLRAPDGDPALSAALLELYEHPERHPGLYNFAKSLEIIESALLGGFYFKHFSLAQNVIGSGAKGTMKKSVAALKKTYERPAFPPLDRTRSALGAKMDAQLIHLKGRIMDRIEQRRSSPTAADHELSELQWQQLSPPPPPRSPTKTRLGSRSPPALSRRRTPSPRTQRNSHDAASAQARQAALAHGRHRSRRSSPASAAAQAQSLDVVRRALYAAHSVPKPLAEAAAAAAAEGGRCNPTHSHSTGCRPAPPRPFGRR